jgi:hypothetical protein
MWHGGIGNDTPKPDDKVSCQKQNAIGAML